MTRARDVADTQDNVGGSVSPVVAGKNFLINGGFDIFQRVAVSNMTDTYGLDRWYKTSSGSGSNVSVTQQTTGVPIGSRFCMRVTMTGVNGYGNQYQIIETANVALLQGKTITLSAKLRRSSGFAGNITLTLEKSATVDAGMGASYTTMAAQGVTNANLPTGTTSSDWYTVQFTVTIPNDNTANTLRVGLSQSQTETSCYWEVAQMQLEIGSVVTPFSRAGGTIQGELAACQRYYQKFLGVGSGQVISGFGGCVTTTIAQASIVFPVQMRTSATSFDGYLPAWYNYANNTTYNSGTFTMTDVTPSIVKIRYTHGSSIFTAGQGGEFVTSGGNGYLAFSAEL